MFRYKFLKILDSLNDNEFKQLGKFVASPYFNESRKMTELYEYLKKYFYTHTLQTLTIEEISTKFIKSGENSYIRVRKLISDFGILLEDFLANEVLNKDRIARSELLSEKYRELEFDGYIKSEIMERKKILNTDNSSCKTIYMKEINSAEEELEFVLEDSNPEKKVKRIIEFIGSASRLNNFMKLYTLHILIRENLYNNDVLNILGIDDSNEFIRDLIKNESQLDAKEKGLYLYYLVLKLIRERKSEKIYDEISLYVDENRNFLNIKDIGFVYYTIVNYVINELSNETSDKIDEAVKMFKNIHHKGYLDNLLEIKYTVYLNVIIFAVLSKELEFAEGFLWKNMSKLKKNKEETVNLAFAYIRFGQKRYAEAKEHINKVNSKEYEFYMGVNGLLLKIYYEDNALNHILPLADSFRHYIKRNREVPENMRESVGIFLNYLMKLTSIKRKSRKDILKIELSLYKEKNFYNKKWIIEKLNEINI